MGRILISLRHSARLCTQRRLKTKSLWTEEKWDLMENTKSEKELRPDEFFSRGFLSSPVGLVKSPSSSSSIGRALWERSKAICMTLMMEFRWANAQPLQSSMKPLSSFLATARVGLGVQETNESPFGSVSSFLRTDNSQKRHKSW